MHVPEAMQNSLTSTVVVVILVLVDTNHVPDVYLRQRLLTSVLFACITRCVLIYVRTVCMSHLHNPVYFWL